MSFNEVKNFINGEFKSGSSTKNHAIISPLDGKKLTTFNESTMEDLNEIVTAAEKAQIAWQKVTLKERAQVFYKYKQLLEKNSVELTEIIYRENGKIHGEAKAEIDKAIELTEFACSLPQFVNGENMEVSRGVYCSSTRIPVGVVASIVPFNFPAMVPHWTIVNALALGNAMILKPSEAVPISAQYTAKLLKEAGLPDGLFNIINGTQSTVENICDHPGIKAVTFVGSTKVAKIVYQRASHNLKQVLALGGAKNHIILLPDAHPDMASSNIVASMSGCAGQRCMAAATLIAVGNCDAILDKLIGEAQKIQCGTTLGAVISKAAKERIENYITEAEQQGAKIILDGRNAVVSGKENGFYVGPTLIDYATSDMKIAREEVFGPVLAIVRVKTIDEALAIENGNPYGNACSVFTQSGGLANYVTENASAGMCGVNIGVPVPREPFGFGGWNESRFGSGDINGKSAIGFFTKEKKTTTKWNPEAGTNWMS
ncbi:CoA-acylating methylmalonate-semialdehyde dehydrogenase [Flavobacterium franklandianum]|uniref:CoA-acylating methylmalonate-semialdehyde dehydrogenase n=1 Tax=Flavobacterium franklandianum TaxID=2594430 RepID=UPI00117ADA4D|nr:CoA-acylating methylmalonate-semialdehyde dehydrogenase [Flavobacterium franklandianum]TRX23367.1 CoA-acylating methylmalonate-semialdehyde dehydrogenase [Flavobacterium franklandianum]